MKVLTMMILAAPGLSGNFEGVQDVQYSGPLGSVNVYEDKNPDIAAIHAEVRRALMEESMEEVKEVMQPMNMEERYRELKRVREIVEAAVAHCQNEECIKVEKDRAIAKLREQGKIKGEIPSFENLVHPNAYPLKEFPPVENFEFEPQQPLQPPPQSYEFDYDDVDGYGYDAEEGYGDYHDFDDSPKDYVDEFDYDAPKRRQRYLSTEDIEEQIRRQVKAQLMEAAKELHKSDKPSTNGNICVPYTTICDLNIVIGVVWTLLVGAVVSVVTKRSGNTSRGKKIKKK